MSDSGSHRGESFAPDDRLSVRRQSAKVAKQVLHLFVDAIRYAAFPNAESRGIYRSFDEAIAAAPRGKRVGYDHDDLAQEFRANLRVFLSSYDYPVLFHLDRILRAAGEGCTVLDFGGNVGVHYLRYRQYLNLDSVSWVVCDVPALTKVGRETCSGISNVVFIEDVAELATSRLDVFLASGSMQYVDSPRDLLSKLGARGLWPQQILIDTLSLYSGPRFVTLQNGGLVCYPEHVFNKDEFIAGIAELGYRLVDLWDRDLRPMTIPFHRDKAIPSMGLCFTRAVKPPAP